MPLLITNLPPLNLQTDENFYPIPANFKKLLNERNDIGVVIINSPNNPTGAVYPPRILRELSEIIKPYPHIAIISDEVYRVHNFTEKEFTYDSIARYLPEQTIVVGGMSKEVSGTGLRVGFAAGPAHVIKAMSLLNGHTCSCINYPTQVGYTKFLQSNTNLMERLKIRDILNERRKLILELFSTLPALKNCILGNADGAFYLFPKIDYFYGCTTPHGDIIKDDIQFSEYLLIEGKVVVLPGTYFNRPGHIRMAYAASDSSALTKGLTSMNNVLSILK